MKGWRNVKQAPSGELYVSESASQTSCVRWFRTVFPDYGEDLFSIPNGAKVGGHVTKKGFPVMAAILKGEGMTEGVADLMLALPRGGFAGMFIEMKTPVGSLSPAQRRFLERRASVGYAVAVFTSQGQFETDVTAYMEKRFTFADDFRKLVEDTGALVTITDGNAEYSAYCTQCGRRSMQVVRPGKVQCAVCGLTAAYTPCAAS